MVQVYLSFGLIKEGVEEGKGARHNFSEVEKATSDKWKKRPLFKKNQVLRSRRTASNFFLDDRFRVKMLGSGVPNFRQSADRRKLGSLHCLVAVMSQLFMW